MEQGKYLGVSTTATEQKPCCQVRQAGAERGVAGIWGAWRTLAVFAFFLLPSGIHEFGQPTHATTPTLSSIPSFLRLFFV
jgi:hypothetical protein